VLRHPLVRSSACHAASPVEQRAAHRALAEAVDPELDPDRRAWRRARATSGPSEEIAAGLENSAERARARGGLAATAALLERAVALTIDPATRAERALAAARANQEAGALEPALGLLAAAESGPLDEFGRDQVEVARAEIAFASSREPDTDPLLLSVAKRIEPLDVALAREIYLAALIAAGAGHLGENGGASEVAQAARAAPAPTPPRAVDRLLDGLALAATEGLPAGAPILREALAAFRGYGLSNEELLRWLGSASHVAELMWDYDAWDALSARAVEEARNQGALRALPVALTSRLGVHLFAGELDVATSLVEQVNAVTDATGDAVGPYARVRRTTVALAGYRGDEAAAAKVFAAATAEFTSRGEAEGLTVVRWATAVLYNGLGRYEEARNAGVRAAAESHEMWFARWGLVDLIEAAARSRDVNLARDALERLARHTSAAGTDWALGIEARSRALVNTGEAAEQLYREAIDALERAAVRVELARARLLYGEWLRRERRRIDAREQLRAAHEMFTEFGMEAFAERARGELSATGERARKRTVETHDDLTPQEANISRLVAAGATNREIAGQLFISSSTVSYHLQKVFRKLGVSSRTQLTRHMLQRPERSAVP
jgi:DNA-binding CsgD family transcriptional regulator